MNYSRSLSISSSSYDPFVDVEEEVSYGLMDNVPVTEIRRRRIAKSSELHEHLDKVMKTFTKLKFFDSIEKLEKELIDRFPKTWDVDKNTFNFSKLTRDQLNEAKSIIDFSLGPVGRHIRSEMDNVLLEMANELKAMSGKVTSEEYRSDLPQIEYSLDTDKLLKEIAEKEKQAALNELNVDDDDMDSDTVSSDDEYQETISTPKIEDVTDFVEPTINVLEHSEYGPILVGEKGMTLYVFTKDEDNKSNCFGDCLVKWPPLKTLGKPNIESDKIVKRKIGSTALNDGNEVVTYFGRPLYYWYQDEKPGDISGQNVGGVWFLVSAKDGKPVKRRRTPLKKVPQKREVKEESAVTLFKVPEAKEKPLKRSKIDEEEKKKQVVSAEKKEELLRKISLPEIKVYQDFFEWCSKDEKTVPENIFRVIKAWFPRTPEEQFRYQLANLLTKTAICSSMRQDLKKFVDLFNDNVQKVSPDLQQKFIDATTNLLSNPKNATMSPLAYFQYMVIPKIK